MVRVENERQPLSEHENATEAERAAKQLARREGSPLVLLHDRYTRVHDVSAREARLSSS